MSTAGGPGRAAGWYPDPSGSTGKFRWWDGSQWTQALSESLWSPAPRDPQPYRALEADPVRRQYVPEFDLDLDEDDSLRRRWMLGGAVVAVVLLVGVLVSLVIWFGRSGASTSDDRADGGRTPSAGPSPGSARPPSTPPSAPPSGPGSEPPPGPDPTGGRLVFDRLPNWVNDPGGAELLPNGQAQRFTTETGPKGTHNDAAVVSGEPPFAAKATGTIATQARTIAQWFVQEEAELRISKPLSGRPVRIDGRDAYVVRTQMAYRTEGIRAGHDDIEVVVISYGRNRPPGVYLATVPETHPQLWKDVEAAKRTLHLAR